MNQMRLNKRYKIIQYLLFPYGIISFSVIWLTSFFTGYPIIFDTDPFTWWGKIIIVFGGELVVCAAVYYASFYIKKPRTDKPIIYLFLIPEEDNLDKYITSDIQHDLQKRANANGLGWFVVVPSFFFRFQILRLKNTYEKQGKNFFNSTKWQRLHKKMSGSFYLLGLIKSRKSQGRDQFVIEHMNMIVAHAKNIPDEVRQSLRDAMKEHCMETVLIEKSYEFESFQFLSNIYVNIIEFTLGISFLISNNPYIAFEYHKRVVNNLMNQRNTFFRQLCSDAKVYLENEFLCIIESLLTTGNFDAVLLKLSEFETNYTRSIVTRYLLAKTLIMKCSTENELRRNIPVALALYECECPDVNQRASFLYNRAYLLLLSGEYNAAEKCYRSARKYPQNKTRENICEYCDWVIMQECKGFEKPTALYVKVKVMYFLKNPKKDIIAVINALLVEVNQPDHYYVKMANKILQNLNQDIFEAEEED